MNGGGTVIRTLRKIQTLSSVLSFRTKPRLGPRRRERVHLKRPIAISSFSPIGEKLEILGAVWGSFTGYKLLIISSLDLMGVRDSHRLARCFFSVSYCAPPETYPQMYPVGVDA